ncbi:ATP-binding cassette domain-containing protein [Mycoplasma sp. NEAQ87857]|uniref:ABC transporter ATP-binding protein n=1 Tax=Mycoplasma sp. NEAQ87857 TaxID=2683967 RepID=UPI00131837B7|nr:ABC transporter ATP-binding protein [Mycoplasma sp. NEAQ87857]QGZ97612.1 ATP-binding cassette domain-containing protein [Mycoplasma sp. NEAQ87857]
MKQNQKISLWQCTYKFRWLILIGIILSLVEITLQVYLPTLLKNLINQGLNNSDYKKTLEYGVKLVIMALVIFLVSIIANVCLTKSAAGFARNMRYSLFSKVQTFALKDVDHFSKASIINRINNDVNNIQFAFNQAIVGIFKTPIMLILALIFSINESLSLSTIFAVSLPLMTILFIIVIRFAYPWFKKVQKTYDKYNSKIQENISSIRVIKSYVAQGNENQKVTQITNDVKDTNIKADKYISWISPIIMGTIFMSILALAYIGTMQVLHQKIQIGTIVAFGSYIWMVSGSLIGLINTFGRALMSLPSLKRVNEIFKYQTSEANNGQEIDFIGDIEFVNVSYQIDKTKILNNVSFKIPFNSSVGILGATGSGKSTIINLMANFYPASDGKILINNTDINQINPHSLRNNISAVFQNNFLFSGSIKDNLLFANPNATNEQMIEVLKEANMYQQYVLEQNDGLDSMIEEQGNNLSGGQKQRFLLARALIKQPQLLILDDATSALDSQTENSIKQSINKINNLTKVIISHKISSVIDLNQIIVLNQGKIEQIGTHQELLKNCKYYQELYQMQMELGDNNE